MAGWEVSRHPEWDMMYAAGLTVREIADRCRQNVATVSLHLRVREKYSPGFRATHEAALAARGPDRPSTPWRKRLTEALAFQETHQRLPRSDGEEAERSLAQWVADQRLSYMKGSMSVSKIVLLDDLKDWHIDVHQDFLRGARSVVEQEQGTRAWFALQLDESTFGIFDVFPDDDARQTHLSGDVGQALTAQTAELFSAEPSIQNIDVLAYKLPGEND